MFPPRAQEIPQTGRETPYSINWWSGVYMSCSSNLPFRQQRDHVIRFMKIAWAKQPWNFFPLSMNQCVLQCISWPEIWCKSYAGPILPSWVSCLWWELDTVFKPPWWKRPSKVTWFTPFPTYPLPPKLSSTDEVRFSLQGPPGKRSISPPPWEALIKMFRACGRAAAEASLSRWDLFTYCPNHFTSDWLVALSAHGLESGGDRSLHCLLNQP